MNTEAVLAIVRGYVDGVYRQDASLLRATFDETAHISGLDEGKYVSVSRDRWIEFVCAPERAGWGHAGYDLSSIQFMETVVVVVLGSQYGKFRYKDTLCMVDRLSAEPVIVSKVFHQAPLVLDERLRS